jgi:hypothetical protein
MTTTAFQYVFNNAESINYNRKAVVASTTTRSGIVRSASRGGQIWRFEVKLPDGISWSDARPYIEAIDAADRYTDGNVQINNAGYNSYLTKYLGNCANTSAVTASFVQGATSITLTGGQAASGFNFKAGDVIQLKSTGKVYSVTSDVAYNVNTVPVNRPILDATSSGTLVIGPNVTWNVICTDLPQWTIFARNQVSWSGAFLFSEVV